MNLDLLDDIYPMMKSKLCFMVFENTGLISGTHRSDRSDKTCQFCVRTYAPLFSGKACMPENIHKDQNLLKMMVNTTSPIFYS
jgi:hypothetical protein